MTNLHEDRAIWVTGAASGIGKAAAEVILSEGGYVVGSDLPTADFSWAKGIDNMRCVTGSVSDLAHNALAVETAVSEFGHLDGAVLNAGMAGRIQRVRLCNATRFCDNRNGINFWYAW